jgi:sugar phosphate isomerase/epimerase
MIKVGIYGSMFGKTDPPQLRSVESFMELAYELKLDAIDFRSDVGFQSREPDYLRGVKIKCLNYGLPIGYLATTGHFVGSEEDLRGKIERIREDVDMAVFLGAPMIRVFCGPLPESAEAQAVEIRCFQEACDIAAEKGIIVGLQNHPCTGEDVLRLLDQTARDNFTLIMDTGQWTGSPARNKGVPDPNYDTYEFMEQTVAHASYVRAKFYKIDSGREEWLDYSRIVDILKGANFNGTMGIVFEGQGVNDCDDREVMRRAAGHLRELLAE